MSAPIADLPYTPQLHGWIQDESTGVHERLVLHGISGLQYQHSHSSHPRSNNLRSTGSGGSSMTPALIYQSNASNGTPSLYSSTLYTDASTAEESVSTDLVDQGLLASYRPLEEVDGVLVLSVSEVLTPEFRCVLWFLNCPYLSRDREEWETHCLRHFHGEDPPRSVICPLCDWKRSCNTGMEAWNLKIAHIADEHFIYGQNLNASRPDFHLYNHLWQKRIIDDQDLKELKSGNHNLRREINNYVTTNGRGSRRERESGRQRLQHVGQSRPRHP